MSSKNFELSNIKGQKIILNFLCSALFIMQLIAAVLVLTGVVDSFGEPLNVIIAINLVFDLFNVVQGAILKCLVNTALGIVYIIVMINIIKNVVSSMSDFTNAVFKKNNKVEIFFKVLINKFGDTLKYCLIWFFISAMTSSNYEINTSGIFLLVACAVVFLLVCVLRSYLESYNLECIIYRTACTALMLLCYALIVSMVQIPTFEQFLYGITIIFNGFFVATDFFFWCQYIFAPIPYCVLQFFVLGFIDDIWGIDFYVKSPFASEKSGKIMIMTIITVFVSLVINLLVGNIKYVNVEQIAEMIKQDIPILLLGVALFISCKFLDYNKKVYAPVSKEKATTPYEPVEKNETVKQTEVVEKNVKEVLKEEKKIEVAVSKVDEESQKNSKTNENNIETLKKYKDLLDSGIITQEEFDVKKKQLLDL